MAKAKNIMISFLFVALLSGCYSATIYKVGDSNGWIANEDSYYDWVYNKEFHVGDSLVFEYDRKFNDVTQVSGALEFEFCDSSSPKAVHRSGHDVVTLAEPGYHYFITSNHHQCTSGQRLDILVVNDPSHPVSPPPIPSNNGNIYKVGDSKGWSVDVDSDYYDKWSEKNQFQVGDNLLFEYDNNEDNDVLEISGDLEFISCDPTSPVSVHKTGHDFVTLTKPGVHYFISSKTGQCAAGLKLRVVVGPIPAAPKVSPPTDDRFTSWLRSFKPKPHH